MDAGSSSSQSQGHGLDNSPSQQQQQSYGATSNAAPPTTGTVATPPLPSLSPQQKYQQQHHAKPKPSKQSLRHFASNGSLSSSSISSSASSLYSSARQHSRQQQQQHHHHNQQLESQQGTKWQTKVRTGQSIVIGFVRRRVPLIGWLVYDPGYNWRANLAEDVFAGITISAVIIPQSLSYAMLASLPPVYGLYTSLVPTIIYAILGTSRHMSTGTFAITSLLLGQFAHKILSDQGYSDHTDPTSEYHRRYLPLCLTLTFVVGGIQILMSIARLGRWTSRHLLPTALVSGFNTASAFHIGTHQLNHWFGMKPPRDSGVFSLIKSWIWIVSHFWQETSWPALSMGVAAMVLMYLLQRLEYYRRAKSDMVEGIIPASPQPSISPSTPLLSSDRSDFSPSPLLHSTEERARAGGLDRSDSRGPRTREAQHMSRVGRPRRRSIVPKAVSDQALLTVQDVSLENDGSDCDISVSARSSPATSIIPAFRDHTNMHHHPVLSPPPHSPLHPYHPNDTVSIQGSAGLANTGAMGQAPRRTSPPMRHNQYRTFCSPSNTAGINHNNRQQRVSFDSADNEGSSRRASVLTISGSSDSEGSSSCSSAHCNSLRTTPYNEPVPPSQEWSQEQQELPQDRSMMCLPKVHFPIPDILICVVIFTAATVIFDLDKKYAIEVIGSIPTGLPTPTWPPVAMTEGWTWETWKPLIWPGTLMAMVVYVMSLSVAKHFGREYGYEVDADQEMLALGAGSLFGSCFGAYVCTGNLTRSAILAQLGSKTPLASLVGALMVLMSLLWFTVLFKRIPNTILATIVLVSLKSLMGHTIEAKRLWRVGRRKEAFIWWSTFMSVIIFSIEIGLAVGMATVAVFKLYKHGLRWKQKIVRSIKLSVLYQRIMLMLGLQSPLHTTAGRGLYTGDDEDDY